MSSTFDEITSILQTKFNVKVALTPASKLNELGLDSLDVINFLFSLEESSGVKIPDDQLTDDGLQTLAGIASYVEGHR